ncbi:hypothetical protein NXH76_12890 [Blautia schinkii]|nr:hypothetical protein [Blautia schinkii]
MRKKILAGLLSLMILTVSGCSQQNQDAVPEETETQDIEAQGTEAEQMKSNGQNILIAYFTWADNTHVENPEEVDVDATTSASVLPPGNAARLAGWIQKEVGGDVFSIQVEEPYSSDYDECLNRAADEKAENARPALSGHVENMSQYDVIFLGFPKMEQGYICV